MHEYIKRLKELREDNDITQKQIAEFLKTSQTMYARYERGASELPIRHLITLCKFYGVSADEVLGIKKVKRIKPSKKKKQIRFYFKLQNCI